MNKKILEMGNSDYHKAEAISNSGLRLIKNNPADYIWNKNAPQDPSKTNAIDLGSAIHTCILEPQKVDSILVGPTKGRDTIKFFEFCEANPASTVLTQSEYDKCRFAVDSALAHPTARKLIDAKGECESSIFWTDQERDILCKIRPDKDLTIGGQRILVDVKTTASIDDWRSHLSWKNPIFTYDYGHNAAYYLKGASAFYGEQYDEYLFLLVQTTACIGRYPVTVISVTREELESYGFFSEVELNLDKYAECLKSGVWDHVETLPMFDGYSSESVESISFED